MQWSSGYSDARDPLRYLSGPDGWLRDAEEDPDLVSGG